MSTLCRLTTTPISNARQYLPNFVEGTDGAFAGFAAGCAEAGKDGCALVVNGNQTGTDIINSVQGLLDVSESYNRRNTPA